MAPSLEAINGNSISSHSSSAAANVDEQQYSYAFQLVSCNVFPMVLHQAIQLDLFRIISNAGPGARLSPSEIATRLSASNPDAPDMLDRVLYLLSSYDILTCFLDHHDDEDGKQGRRERSRRVYGLAPCSKYFVPNEDGVSFGPLVTMGSDKVFMASWYNLKDAILHGGVPFDKEHGMNAFEYAAKDPRYNHIFNQAMYNQSSMVLKEILDHYEGFEKLGHKCLVDVGGGLGQVIGSIVSKYPTIKGVNFDLPHVIKQAPIYPGVEHIGGDMFENIPQGDAIFMKYILHDWSDAHSLMILKNCYRALPENGKVIVVEMAIPETPDSGKTTKSMAHMDLVMMTINPGGRERSKADYMALAKQAGFSGTTFEHCFSVFSVMEFIK